MSNESAALSTIALEPGSLVIADLHLDVASDDARETGLERWLAGRPPPPRLIVLGDLFDAWIGPAQSELSSAKRVLELFARLTRAGTSVDLLRGNRDFLLGEDFEQRTGCKIWPDGFVGLVGDQRVLFIHGDELCTLDHGYQRLRRVLRSGPVIWAAPKLPRSLALSVARRLRRASTRAVAMKPAAEKQQQESEVRRLAELNGCTTLVCGHAHVFRDVQLAGGPRWIVLGAFGESNDLLRVATGSVLEVATTSARVDPTP